MTDQVVILGAGRPHRGDVAAALRTDRGGTPVLEWLIDALGVRLSEVTFVGGFGVAAIRARYPGLRVVVPPDWQETGSAASLLSVPLDPERAALVAYSDILVRPGLVARLMAIESMAAIAWDSHWRDRFDGRQRSVLAGREKVVVDGAGISRLGVSVPVDAASGEFVGLVRFARPAVRAVERLRSSRPRAAWGRAHLSELLQELRDDGVNLVGVDAAGDWAEVNEPADIARFVLGTKADTLARLRRTVLTARIADQVTRTVAEWERDPDGAVREVARVFGDRPLIVRSSTTHEDAFSASNAGGFTSVLGVSVRAGLVDAVTRVAASYRRADIDADVQQILVQPLIEGVAVSGVALTRTLDHGAPWRVLQYTTDGDTEAVTSGASGDLRTLVARRSLVPGQSVPGAAAVEVQRVATLLTSLEEVEALLGHDALDVEFAIDRAGVPHLLQVRPLVTAEGRSGRDASFAAGLDDAHRTWERHAPAPRHFPGAARAVYGVMPDWNPAEIVGTAPGRLALDLYRQLITDEVWATQRAEVGYRDVRPAPLLVTFAGRPYVDVRASFTSFIPRDLDDGLAGRLLAGALDRLIARPELHDKVEFAIVPTCIDPDWSRWDQVLRAEGFAIDEVGRIRAALTTVSATILDRVDVDLATVRGLAERSAGRSRGAVTPLARAALLLDEARSSGALPFAHLARAAFVAVSQLKGAEAQGILSPTAVTDFYAGVRTVSHELSDDASAVAAGRLDWEAFVARWGHLRPGTYEVTSPRYDADPDRFLRPLVDSAGTLSSPPASDTGRSDAGGTWGRERAGLLSAFEAVGLGGDLDRGEQVLRRAIEGRESAKLAFTRNLSDAMELIASVWQERGLERQVIADAPLRLLLPDAAGGLAAIGEVQEQAEQGRSVRELAEAAQLPPLLTAAADLDVFVLTAGTPNFVGTRAVTAPVVTISSDAGPATHVRGRIVLIPRADPGFDWLFGHGLVGLITVYGGANSHMAIRAAEFGLSAAIGIGEQRYQAISAASEVELDPRGRTLRVLR
jgi:choline kinase